MRRVAAMYVAGLLAVFTCGASLAQSWTQLPLGFATSPTDHPASVPWVRSAWVKGYQSRARLIAGASEQGGGSQVIAAIELELPKGWKTYWRNPGDDGGFPPVVDWSASSNLASARLLFPAPKRIKGVYGASIGYKGSLVLPIELVARDPTRAIGLRVALQYGICREICVPSQASMHLVIPQPLTVLPPVIVDALSKVPRTPDQRRPRDPALIKTALELTGSKPAMTFAVATHGAGAIDLFVEGPRGTMLPMAQPLGPPQSGIARFRVDLTGVERRQQLRGKTLRVTITSAAGSSEQTLKIR